MFLVLWPHAAIGCKFGGSFSICTVLCILKFLPSGLDHGLASLYVVLSLAVGFSFYWREAEDLRAVIQHFHESNRGVSAIVGHSKGILTYSPHSAFKSVFSKKKRLRKDKSDSI